MIHETRDARSFFLTHFILLSWFVFIFFSFFPSFFSTLVFFANLPVLFSFMLSSSRLPYSFRHLFISHGYSYKGLIHDVTRSNLICTTRLFFLSSIPLHISPTCSLQSAIKREQKYIMNFCTLISLSKYKRRRTHTQSFFALEIFIQNMIVHRCILMKYDFQISL